VQLIFFAWFRVCFIVHFIKKGKGRKREEGTITFLGVEKTPKSSVFNKSLIP
jgi:hypothetical protein